MPSDQAEGFIDNWAYLKTELRWLDQVLMLAVTRQRKDHTDVERIAQSKADRATSAWWKGIISTDGKAVYDEHRQPTQPGKTSYQQQLEGKIQASYHNGIVLALPTLRDRLGLTVFEKNLVLMSLAPEVNRRYARLYRYLQEDNPHTTDLPTIDLILRLLCRNDDEWRVARHRLVSDSPLLHHKLLQFCPDPADSLLNCYLKLTEPLVNYLLAEQPNPEALDQLLLPAPASAAPPSLLRRSVLAVEWSDLVLPAPLINSLQALVQRIEGQAKAEEMWGFQSISPAIKPGAMVALVGATGTGKTSAAAAISRALQTLLVQVDLALVEPEDHPRLLQEILTKAPKVLLLKSAHLWLGRSSLLSPAALHQFWQQRQRLRGITLLSLHQSSGLQPQWRQQVDYLLKFPQPQFDERLRLWQQAFPLEVPLSQEIDWQVLAKHLPLTGKEIATLAQDAIFQAAATAATQVEMHHILQALHYRGKTLKLPAQPVRSTPATRKKSPTQPTKTTAKTTAKTAAKRLNSAPVAPIAPIPPPSVDTLLETEQTPIAEQPAKKPRSRKKALSD